MIKAEVITHEGNPGPNWLDQCRTMITPGRTTALVVVVAVAAFVGGVLKQGNSDTASNLPPTSASKQTGNLPLSALKVQPLRNSTATEATSKATVQAAGGTSGAGSSPVPTATNAALGAGSTPSLNNATTPASANQNQTTDQSQLNGKILTNNVQSTVQDIEQTLKKPLGL